MIGLLGRQRWHRRCGVVVAILGLDHGLQGYEGSCAGGGVPIETEILRSLGTTLPKVCWIVCHVVGILCVVQLLLLMYVGLWRSLLVARHRMELVGMCGNRWTRRVYVVVRNVERCKWYIERLMIMVQIGWRYVGIMMVRNWISVLSL